MRIAIFSDLHSDAHEDFSYQLPNGLNSRLSDCLDVIDKVGYYRDKYDCDAVVFAGDLFHTPLVLSTVVFQETFKRLEKLAEHTKHLVLLAGNHDTAAEVGGNPVSSVYATRRLPNTTTVVGRVHTYQIDDVIIHAIPYIKDSKMIDHSLNKIREVSRNNKMNHIAVTHIGLDQAVNGPNEIKLKTSYAVTKLHMLGMNCIFSGHHHHPQNILRNHVVIGSPLQMNMLDRGDKRGILIYDTLKKSVIRIWLRGSRFFLYNIESKEDFDKMKRDDFSGGYVRVMLTQGVVPEEKVEETLKSAKMYKILPMRSPKSGIRSQAVTSAAMAGIGNLEAAVKDYVMHVRPPGLNRKRLITIGKHLLKESNENDREGRDSRV